MKIVLQRVHSSSNLYVTGSTRGNISKMVIGPPKVVLQKDSTMLALKTPFLTPFESLYMRIYISKILFYFYTQFSLDSRRCI